MLAPYLAAAEAAVKRDGWRAYPKFLEKGVTPGTVRKKVLPTDPESLMASAILHCLVDYRMRQLADPNSIEMATRDSELQDLAEWYIESFKVINGRLYVTEEFSTMMTHLYHTSVHRRTGENTYEVSAGLGDRLAHTEVRGLTTEDIRLPFPNIYIIVPPEAGLKLNHIKTGEHVCNGFYVTEDLNGGKERIWKIMALGASNNSDPTDDALFHFSMSLPPGQDLDETLMQHEERNSIAMTQMRTTSSRDYYKRSWRDLFKFVLNVVLYITYPDARKEFVVGNPEARKLMEQMKKHPKGSNKYERARERLKGIQQQRRVYLGRGLEPLTDTEAESGTPRGPLTIRVRVPGHWRMQPYGPNSSLRKIIWIDSFWRGPLDGPEVKTIRVL